MPDLHSIRTAGRKEIPKGTMLTLALGTIPGTVRLTILLPGQIQSASYENLPINEGIVTLPVPLAFLSYAKEDAEAVRELSARLLQDGIMSWFDETSLLPGDDWRVAIQKGMDTADYVLIFLSTRSVSKIGFFQSEVRYALELAQLRPIGTRFLIPVLLDDCDPPDAFKHLHWLRLRQENWYELLKRALQLP